MAIDEHTIRELQARNQQLTVEIYRHTQTQARPGRLVAGGVLLGAGIMAGLLVLLASI